MRQRITAAGRRKRAAKGCGQDPRCGERVRKIVATRRRPVGLGAVAATATANESGDATSRGQV
jgi:hypothetical protein